MIVKNIKVGINNNSTSLKSSIVLYKGDFGLLLNITIEGFKFKLSSIEKIHASIVNKETSDVTTLKNLNHDGYNIILPIHDTGISLSESGTYQVQLHIFDNDYNRISTPTFDIICKDTIY